MGFIERLRQQKEAESAARQQRASELAAAKQVEDAARQQRETQERELHQQRRQQAEKFREESGVGIAVAELGKFLGTTRITRSSFYYGQWSDGSMSFLMDRDSACDSVSWDKVKKGITREKSRYSGWDEHFAEKYIAVETCPNGTIVFHGGWFGSTTIPLERWRTNDREQIFDKALEKAYKHPGVNRYAVHHNPTGRLTGFG